MSAPVLQFKRGNAGLAGTVPALRPGEPAISLNNFDFFVGIDTSVANNKFFGSHRYWSREDGTNSLSLKLVDKDGTNSISLKSPNTLSGNGTYTLPDTNTVVDGYFLKVSSGGGLSWQSISSDASFSNASLSGITTIAGTLNVTADSSYSGINTFTNTTDNTLGNPNTGAVQIDGGLGVDKNVTVGGNLNIQGHSEFVGVVTFKGGTINLGDEDTDDINVAGEFISNLVPNTTDTYDIGIGAKGWRHASFTGIGTFASGAVIDAIRIGISGVSEIDTSSGNLILDSATGITQVDDDLNVSGNVTVTGDVAVNGGDLTTTSGTFNLINANATTVNFAQAATSFVMGSTSGIATIQNLETHFTGDIRVNGNDIKSSSGATVLTLNTDDATFASDLTVQGNLYVNGSTTQVNTASLTVEDRTVDLGFVGGSAPTSSTTWDLGLLFNYHDGTGAKKSAVVWEYSTLRFQFANTLTSETASSDVNNPQLVVANFAPIEIGSLWVNDCAGQSQVISCTGTERFLENITVDAGEF
jgi:hypothetical protein